MANEETFNEENRPASQSDSPKTSQTPIKSMANEVVTHFKERTDEVLNDQKSYLTSGINNVAESVRKVTENLDGNDEENAIAKMTAQYVNDLAGGLEKLSNYVETTTLKDLAQDVEGFARRQPTLFVAGAFALGLIAARFLKTSHPMENFNLTLSEDEARNRANRKNYAHPQVGAEPV